jgi:hypothetical protein
MPRRNALTTPPAIATGNGGRCTTGTPPESLVDPAVTPIHHWRRRLRTPDATSWRHGPDPALL